MASEVPAIENYGSREEWLNARSETIGGSDAPIVLGRSPFCSPLKLWSQKTGRIPPDQETPQMRRGTRMEPVVAEMVAEEKGWDLEHPGSHAIVRHAQHSWMSCTLDRVILDNERGAGDLQIKTANAFRGDEWGNGPPLYVQIQVQHELAVTGFGWGAVAVLIGNDDLRVFEVERNERFIAALIARESAFIELIRSDQPPTADGSAATAEALAKLYPRALGTVIDLPPEAASWDEELLSVKGELDRLESRKRELENRIKSHLGDAAYGLLPNGGRYSWREVTRNYEAREAHTTTFREFRRLRK